MEMKITPAPTDSPDDSIKRKASRPERTGMGLNPDDDSKEAAFMQADSSGSAMTTPRGFGQCTE
jgi:hypothetical protein